MENILYFLVSVFSKFLNKVLELWVSNSYMVIFCKQKKGKKL